MNFIKRYLPAFILYGYFYFQDISNRAFYFNDILFEIKIIVSYIFLILTFTIFSNTLLEKKERYKRSLILTKESYIKYFLKNITFIFILYKLFFLKAHIDNPSLLKISYNIDFLRIFFNIIIDNFSPIYFSIIIILMAIIAIYKAFKNYGNRSSILYTMRSLIVTICIIYFSINYNLIYATYKPNNPNVIILGFENIKQSDINHLRDKYFKSKDFWKHTYNFENYYAISSNYKDYLLSLLYGIHPQQSEVYGLNYKNNPLIEREKSLIHLLRKDNYRDLIISENKFKFLNEFSKNLNYFPLKHPKGQLRSKLLSVHATLLPFLLNPYLDILFPETLYLPNYYPKYHFSNKLESFITNNHKRNSFIFTHFYAHQEKNLPYPFYGAKQDNYLRFIASEIQKILNLLKNHNLEKNTIILITGIPSKEGLHTSHIKIPLSIYNPHLQKERIIHNNYSTPDILPTMYEIITGKNISKKYYGKSLFDIPFTREKIYIFNMPKDSILSSSTMLKTSLSFIKGDYKINITPQQNQEVVCKLFDIDKDPLETIDISDSKPEIKRKMLQFMEKDLKDHFRYLLYKNRIIKNFYH